MGLMTIFMAAALIGAGPLDPTDITENPEQAARHDYCDAALALDSDTLSLVDARLADDAVGVTESQLAAGLLVRAGTAIAAVQPDIDTCRAVFAKGQADFDTVLSLNVRIMNRNVGGDLSRDPEIRRVQTVINTLWVADQAGRVTYSTLQTRDRTGSAFWAQRLATANAVMTDARSTLALRELLKTWDWIDRHRFGSSVSSHAWILAQHADDHPDFQREVLARMEPHLENGGVRPRDYAYLWDRVAVNTGELQRYGTQPMDTCNADGTLDLKPMEDPEQVDARRATMGLGPASADREQMARERCGLAG